MKRIMIAGILGVPVLVAAALVFSGPRVVRMTPTVWADEGAPCSLGSAAGNWSFTDNGTIVSPPLGLRACGGEIHAGRGGKSGEWRGHVEPEWGRGE